MTVKQVVQKQYQALADEARRMAGGLKTPSEGWLRTMRKALGISGAQLGRRMSVSRANVLQSEKAELEGRITLKAMRAAAAAMDCRLVYAIVPNGGTDAIIERQARSKATAIVRIAGAHMALESQALDDAATDAEIERLTRNMIVQQPADFWDDK